MHSINPVVMPKLGSAMQEGTISEWIVDVGESVNSGDDLVILETDKSSVEYESPTTGIVRRHVTGDGDTVPVGNLIAVIASADASDEDIDQFVRDFRPEQITI